MPGLLTPATSSPKWAASLRTRATLSTTTRVKGRVHLRGRKCSLCLHPRDCVFLFPLPVCVTCVFTCLFYQLLSLIVYIHLVFPVHIHAIVCLFLLCLSQKCLPRSYLLSIVPHNHSHPSSRSALHRHVPHTHVNTTLQTCTWTAVSSLPCAACCSSRHQVLPKCRGCLRTGLAGTCGGPSWCLRRKRSGRR